MTDRAANKDPEGAPDPTANEAEPAAGPSGRETQMEEVGPDYRAQAEDYKNQILRLQAEFSNYRKRTEKEKAEAMRFGRETMLEHLISMNDVMDQALKHAAKATDLDALKKGFEMVVKEFARFLKSQGAEPLAAVGRKFDPHKHEAVEQVETDQEGQNDVVVEELQKGYMANGRLLRSAKVKVAKFKAGSQPEK